MDSDGQHLYKDLKALYDKAVSVDADMVVGSRKGKKDATFLRAIGKKIIRIIVRILMPLPIYDLNSGMKLYRRDLAINYFHMIPDNFTYTDIIVLMFINQKHLVVEEKIDIRERVAGKSTLGFRSAVNSVYEIINIVTLFNPMRIFLPISIIFLVFGVIWGINIYFRGDGVSVGSSLLIIIGILIFLLGLITEQISKIRISMSHGE